MTAATHGRLVEDLLRADGRDLDALRALAGEFGYRLVPDRVVATAEELEALPQWTVLLACDNEVIRRGRSGFWVAGDDCPRSAAWILNGAPFQVLWTPDGAL